MPRAPFVWEGIEHWTGVDLTDTLSLISTQDEADSFMVAYGELWENEDEASTSLAYWLLLTEDAPTVAELLGIELPTKGVVISPRQTWGRTSLGVEVLA